MTFLISVTIVNTIYLHQHPTACGIIVNAMRQIVHCGRNIKKLTSEGNMEDQKCKYKPTDRAGLYILIFLIFLSTVIQCPGCGDKRYREIVKRLDKIEAKVDSLKINQ